MRQPLVNCSDHNIVAHRGTLLYCDGGSTRGSPQASETEAHGEGVRVKAAEVANPDENESVLFWE